MKEFYTKAIVLSKNNIGESDALIRLFTENYGKVSVKARSMRKITSKLSAHFEPMSFVKVRFVPRSNGNNGFVLLDGVIDDFSDENKTTKNYNLIPIINFIDRYTFDLQKDEKVWHFLREVFSGSYNIQEASYILLSVLGFSPENSNCFLCKEKDVESFNIEFNNFLCKNCAFKFSKDDILYINKPKLKKK